MAITVTFTTQFSHQKTTFSSVLNLTFFLFHCQFFNLVSDIVLYICDLQNNIKTAKQVHTMLSILHQLYNLDDISHCLIETRIIKIGKNRQP